jgi:hypothetical protein
MQTLVSYDTGKIPAHCRVRRCSLDSGMFTRLVDQAIQVRLLNPAVVQGRADPHRRRPWASQGGQILGPGNPASDSDLHLGMRLVKARQE